MTAKKKTNRGNAKKRSKKKSAGLKTPLFKAGLSVLILIILVAAAGVLAHRMMALRQSGGPVLSVEKIPEKKIPAYEVYPGELLEPSVPTPEPEPRPKARPKPRPEPKPEPRPEPRPEPQPKTELLPRPGLPELAIIIDDIGYDRTLAENFVKLNSSLTLSILPKSPFCQKVAKIARDKGLEIMLHLPMEPREYPEVDPGPGALLTGMTPDQLIRQLEENLDAVPGIKGVNNHMGSEMTADSARMNQIFSILKKRGLYYIDSKTTSKSVCKSSAVLFQIPFSERDVFIDHFQDARFIRNQLELMVKIAERHGTCVGIGHPHTVTYQVLRDMLPGIKKKVNIVPASQLVKKIEQH
jgi:polysaccharide deacetylase 2 family uncharacterized protein YibQ